MTRTGTRLDPRTPANWAFTTLRGKVPVRKGWQTEPPMPREELEAWPDNIGLRTGTVSGVVVIDVDTAKGGQVPPGLPPAPRVRTGSGGLHIYFRAPDPPVGNSAGRLGAHVDVRGDGGQVVYPGSVHPDTRALYAWEAAPWDVPPPDLPAAVLARLRHEKLSAYAQAAVDKELAGLRAAPVGERNETLNKAAFALFQLVAGGEVPQAPLVAQLRAVALELGLTEKETDATIESAARAGMRTPRTAPPPRERVVSGDPTRTVLIPGEHIQGDSGEVVEQGADDFAVQVLRALPPGTLYRREYIVGELVGPQGQKTFRAVNADRLRLWIDRHITLAKWTKSGKAFRSCSKDQASIVLAAAATSSYVLSLHLLTHYPVFAGVDFALSTPGYNASTGVFYDEPPELEGIGPVPYDGELLTDLIVDFPFRDTSSMVNLFGLMLTPLIRPAVDTVPLHLVQSSIERTGKGLLISAVLGHAILGTRVPSVQLGEREEEREKRITSMILEGATIVHLDNLPAASVLDSPSLASLLTSPTWKGRTLGASSMPDLPNPLTLVASANNLRASAEISKRIVPIWLEPTTDHPETREDFEHPDALAYAAGRRREVLACLLGMVSRWVAAGRPAGKRRLGGFEAWAAAVGGILELHSMGPDWLENREEWSDQADEWSQDVRALVDAWWARYGTIEVSGSQVLEIVVQEKLFPDVLAKAPGAQLQTLGRRVLSQLCNRPVGGWKVRKRSDSHAGSNRYYLQQAGGDPAGPAGSRGESRGTWGEP